MDRYSELVEEKIREAMERGEFDDLRGAGRPLELGEDDPAWWARRKLRQITEEDRLHTLARDFQRQIDDLMYLPDADEVVRRAREVDARRVALNDLLPADLQIAPIDEGDVVRQWRAMYRLRRRN